MRDSIEYLKKVLEILPNDWLNLTTHRLDIYDESRAKTEFLEEFEKLFEANNVDSEALNKLPTAYDYIRLGHPLSSILEWALAKLNSINTESVISFSSKTMPILAVLRKNLFLKKDTLIYYENDLPKCFDAEAIRKVYGYGFELKKIQNTDEIKSSDASVIYLTKEEGFGEKEFNPAIDFYLNIKNGLGSIIYILGEKNQDYISEIQHVRRRESIAMTPANCLVALKALVNQTKASNLKNEEIANKNIVIDTIKGITDTTSSALLASSGLSIQYAIMMGLIEDALDKHPNKTIQFIVPSNCYGGTNDQARRVAAAIGNVEIADLLVDGDNDMISSLHQVLDEAAKQDTVPYIIAEIPTNPRVEVPNLNDLKEALTKVRKTEEGSPAVSPTFVIDQTFCPNFQFLSEKGILNETASISYVSGSKFPSGGKCTAGYCVVNNKAKELLAKIEKHLLICDNSATDLQVRILSEQMPSMLQRIEGAYKNTREFVNYIMKELPSAKINFVSEELAKHGFRPSVFSLDLPTKGNSDEEREEYKRALNHKLIKMMIEEIPNESKYCVSYGQLKGCYWTIPATSTQGTTMEAHKDYIARVSVSPNLDLEKHKSVFKSFVKEI